MKERLAVRVRFGAFELDVKAGELHYQNRSTLLQEQSFRLLLALIEREGELVTREELKKQLWPNDTIVEFDLGINAAIKRLRRILGDSPEQPKYIGTVARRGYRLVAPVEWLPPASDAEAATDEDRGAGKLDAEPGGPIDQEVSHYRILDRIGGGGMGVIYKAEDLRLGRFVALKFLPEEFSTDARALSALEKEACLASSLNHPNICSIYELGTHGGQPFIAMELLAGETLKDRLGLDHWETAGPVAPVPINRLLDIAIQVCHGLQAAHEKGIVHRDIKPANLFMTSSGVVKILDFGLAKLVRNDASEVRDDERDVAPSADPSALAALKLSRTGIAIGTAAYMSPEHIRGERLDARTDLFSLGVVLYQMASGTPPFRGDTPALLFDAVLHQTPVAPSSLNPGVPAGLEQIVNRALEKDRNLRYQSAAEMEAELRRVASPPTPVASIERENQKAVRHRLTLWWRTGVLALLVAATVGGGLYWHWRAHRAAALPGKGTIVVAEFDNKTGDSVFDDTLRLGLSADLEQSPFLELLPDDRVAQTLALMKQPKNARLTPEIVREVCIRTGSAATLEGSIATMGKEYVVGLKAVNCHGGGEIATQEFTVDSKEKILPALGNAASQMRRSLGEGFASLQQHNVSLADVTTSSLEALKAYTQGERAVDDGDYHVGITLAKRAIDLDSNFALAYMMLGVDYDNLGLTDQGNQYLRRAYELRDHVSEPERLEIVAFYTDDVLGNTGAAREAYQVWTNLYPNTLGAPTNLAADDTILGDYNDALVQFKKVASSNPNSPLSYSNLFVAYLYLNRFDEAKYIAQQATARNLDTPALHLMLYWLHFLEHDRAGMELEKSHVMGKPGWEDQILNLESDTAAYGGRFRHARELTAAAVDSAERAKEKDAAAAYKAEAAVRDALVGNLAIARQEALAALALSDIKDATAMSAVVLAWVGHTAKATHMANNLSKRFPEDTIMQSNYLPTIRAAVAIRSGDADKALQVLAPAEPYELGAIQGSASFMLYPVYLRGEAYLVARRGNAAAAEFRKILGHPGIVGNEPIGALAHLGLARAYVLEVETDPAARDKARAAYQDFLTLWKDADPDLPIYRQARAECAKLHDRTH